ncbi:MAG: hypothetical protein B6D58_06845 [candidate division Zixibacteria bacterium 4484_95]|nr:MAG: hypothetical protein B6D58_06845 [candidate division Zixibacteria bacterium 4484_95]RKX21091.1 MAG: hypothetical protein DRP26_00375 [candidate division Zixibacteria bacterium]
MKKNVLNIAHRGASAFLPDNTIESFKQALVEKADMIELDIRKTADGEIVLFHDWYVKPDRFGSSDFSITRPVSHISFKELSEFCEMKGFGLASLKEILQQFGGYIDINIELKAGGYEYEVLDLVKKYNLKDSILISSFFPWVIKKVKDIDRDIKTGWIAGQEQIIYLNRLVRPWIRLLFKMTGADTVHLHSEIVTAEVIRRFHFYNIPVYAWTVDNISAMHWLIELDVDGIITNRPGQLYSLLNDKPLTEETIILSNSELATSGKRV